MNVAALLSSLRKRDSWSVKLGAAKFVEVVMVYSIFCGADFSALFLKNKHNK